jgi:hypothetical protein
MKLNFHRVARQRGVLLLDALVYISVLGLVLVLAAVVFDKGMRESAGLQRNVADIERALKAGERWRADVRAAIGTIEVTRAADGATLAIPQASGRVIYEIRTNEVRRVGSAAKPEVVLTGVKAATMESERRGNVTGWKWELELEQRRKEARVRPLFTFMAVSGGVK